MKRACLIGLVVLAFLVGGVVGWRVQVYRFNRSMRRAKEFRNRFLSAARTKLGIPKEAQGKLSLFILAGQSNMSGRAKLPKECTTHPRIFMLGNNGRWQLAAEPLDNPTEQVDMVSYDGYYDAGVGPGMSFALELVRKDSEMYVGLIPCARGGTSLYEWRRDLSDTSLYGSCLKRAFAARTMGKIVGLLWFQGEADARDPNRWPKKKPVDERWPVEFEALMAQFRKDLSSPKLPIVFAQIGTHTDPELYPNWDKVKESQRKVRMPYSAMITTEDLELRDTVHFTADSYREIGRRFARAYCFLVEGSRRKDD